MPPLRPLLLLLSAVAIARAGNPEYSRRIWRTDDGLPQNKIQVISQTADGFLWIGTAGGLVRFDGVHFVVFDRANTPAFRDDSILSLMPGRDGELWIGTEGGGLVRLERGVFTTFGQEQGITNRFVRTLLWDRSGTLWVGTDRGFFRKNGLRFDRLDNREGVPIFAARCLAEDRNGQIWLGTSVGVYRVENGSPRPAGSAFAALGISILAIQPDRDGSMWFGGDSGLWHVERGLPVLVNRVAVRALRIDSAGSLWAGTAGHGLIRQQGGKPGDLPDNSVGAVFEDRESNLWVGTDDGLVRFTRGALTTFTTRDGLADDNVATVYEDRAGTLWIATAAGEIYRREGNRLVRFGAPGLNAVSIYMERGGAYWFGTMVDGALRRSTDGRNRIFSMAVGMRSNSIRQFLEASDGMLWMATGSGLTRWDGHSIRTFYLEDGLSYGGIHVLAEDAGGDLLVGTDGGINRVRAGHFIKDAAFAKLGDERVWSILPMNDGTLWLGTRGDGVYRIHDGVIRHLTTRDGLLSNSVFQILNDQQGRLWFSTPAGIFSADRKELDAGGPLSIVPYGAGDGLDSTQMNGGFQTAGCRTRNGELWFPSAKGAVRVDPGQTNLSPASPVLIDNARLDDKPLPLAATAIVPAGSGKLEIDFTSCALRSPDRVTFEYRMEGLESEWIVSPHTRSAVYAKLPPGTHVFHVRARDGAFPGKTTEATMSFIWEPQFWETAWFRLAVFASAGLLAWVGSRVYARQTQARYALVLAERTRVAREMHDTLLQGCVGVSTLLEAASAIPASQQTLLDHARSQIRLTIDEARDALWDLRNPKMDGEFSEVLGALAEHISRDSGVPVVTEIAGRAPPLDPHVARTLLLVAREAIRNAIAHASPAHVAVRVEFLPDTVRLQVVDDGIGFAPDALAEGGHFGIVGMRERVAQLDGDCSIESALGAGTTVRAVIRLRQSAG